MMTPKRRPSTLKTSNIQIIKQFSKLTKMATILELLQTASLGQKFKLPKTPLQAH